MVKNLGRVKTVGISSYSWAVRILFWLQKRKYGQVLAPMEVWGRSTSLALAMTAFFQAVNRKRSPLPPDLRALITVLVSQTNDCAFCVDINSLFWLERGGSQEKLADLPQWRTSSKFSEKEKAALAYAIAMTDSHQRVTPEIFRELQKFYGEEEIIELTGLISFQNLSSKFNNALDIPSQGFCVAPSSS